jgi:flagellar biosynthesis chaperone FliJ
MAQSQPIAKQRLQALLNQLLEGVTDEELQQMQQQMDQLEARRAAAGHHDHDHPSRA